MEYAVTYTICHIVQADSLEDAELKAREDIVNEFDIKPWFVNDIEVSPLKNI